MTRNKIEKQCAICSKAFLTWKSNPGLFCSPKCYQINRRKEHPEIIRKLNRESFYRHHEKRLAYLRNRPRNRVLKNKFSMNVEHKYRYEGMAGKVLETDNGQCISCESKNDLIVHHYNKNKKDNRIENLVTLCRGCHARLHNYDKDFGGKNNQLKGFIRLSGVYLFTLRDAVTNAITKRHLVFNIIPTTGRTLIANNLTDATPDNNIRLNKAALGTSTSTPANGDTQLGAETYRNDLASRTNANNIAYVTAFFNATEVTGTFREAGIFADGGSGANTGVLFSRVAINITKSNTQTLTLDWTLTIS